MLNSYHWETMGNNSQGVMDGSEEMIVTLAKMVESFNNKVEKLSSIMVSPTCESCFARGHEAKICTISIEDKVSAMYARETSHLHSLQVGKLFKINNNLL